MRKLSALFVSLIVSQLYSIDGMAFPNSELAESIVVSLEENTQDYEEAVFHRLNPKVQDLQAEVSIALAAVQTAWNDHQNHPSNETFLAYQEAVSKSLHAINNRFESILEEEIPFEQAALAFQERLAAALSSVAGQIGSASQSRFKESEEAVRHESNLVELAHRHRQALDVEGALPRDVNEVVRSLEIQIQGNRQRSQLQSLHAGRLEEWEQTLQTLEKGIAKCTSAWRTLFDQVAEDQETLAVIVDAQAEEAEIFAAVRRVSSVVTEWNKIEGALPELRKSFDGFLQVLAADGVIGNLNSQSFKDWANSPDNSGKEILMRYLQEERSE